MHIKRVNLFNHSEILHNTVIKKFELCLRQNLYIFNFFDLENALSLIFFTIIQSQSQ
jgi:hypothetical protein